MAGEDRESENCRQQGWLFIAWVFGRETIFENLAMDIVKRSFPRFDGSRWKDMKTSFDMGASLPEPTPPRIVGEPKHSRPRRLSLILTSVIESIIEKRNKLIGKILDIFYDAVENFETELCNVHCLTREKIIEDLSQERSNLPPLWPRKSPEDIAIDITCLVIRLQRLPFFHRSIHPDVPPRPALGPLIPRHFRGCINNQLFRRLREEITNMESSVLECHR